MNKEPEESERKMTNVEGRVVDINRNRVRPFLIVVAVLMSLATFVGITDKEGWSIAEIVPFAPANEEAVWFCQVLEDAQGEPFLFTMLELYGGTKARGWMDADGSPTPKGDVARTDAMEMCPDLYAAFKRTGDNVFGSP